MEELLMDYVERVENNSPVVNEGFKFLESDKSWKMFDLGDAILKCHYYISGSRKMRSNYFEIGIKNPESKSINYKQENFNLASGDFNMFLLLGSTMISVLTYDVEADKAIQNTSINYKGDGVCSFVKIEGGKPVDKGIVSLDDIVSSLETGDYSVFVTCEFGKGSSKKL